MLAWTTGICFIENVSWSVSDYELILVTILHPTTIYLTEFLKKLILANINNSSTYSSANFSQQWAAVKANLSLMRTDEHNWLSLASTWLSFIICRISSVKFGFNLFLPHTVKEIGTYILFQSPLQYHEVWSIWIKKLTEIISGTIRVLFSTFNLIFCIQGWEINLGYNLINDIDAYYCDEDLKMK